MNNIIVKKSFYVEIPAPLSTAPIGTVKFPELQNLSGKYLQGLTFFTPNFTPVTPTNVPVVNLPLIIRSFVTLVVGDVNQVLTMPLAKLCPWPAASGPAFAVEFNNLPIVWSKCFITCADLTLFAPTAESFAFDIHYADPIGKNQPSN